MHAWEVKKFLLKSEKSRAGGTANGFKQPVDISLKGWWASDSALSSRTLSSTLQHPDIPVTISKGQSYGLNAEG